MNLSTVRIISLWCIPRSSHLWCTASTCLLKAIDVFCHVALTTRRTAEGVFLSPWQLWLLAALWCRRVWWKHSMLCHVRSQINTGTRRPVSLDWEEQFSEPFWLCQENKCARPEAPTEAGGRAFPLPTGGPCLMSVCRACSLKSPLNSLCRY